MVFANHVSLVKDLHVSLLDRLQFALELVDVVFLAGLELLHYFLLGAQLTLEVLLLGGGLVDLLLELLVLRCHDFNLPIDSLELNLCILGGQSLVLEVTLGLQELSAGLSMLLLFFFIPLNPCLSRLLFSGYDLVQTCNLLIELLPRQLC